MSEDRGISYSCLEMESKVRMETETNIPEKDLRMMEMVSQDLQERACGPFLEFCVSPCIMIQELCVQGQQVISVPQLCFALLPLRIWQ